MALRILALLASVAGAGGYGPGFPPLLPPQGAPRNTSSWIAQQASLPAGSHGSTRALSTIPGPAPWPSYITVEWRNIGITGVAVPPVVAPVLSWVQRNIPVVMAKHASGWKRYAPVSMTPPYTFLSWYAAPVVVPLPDDPLGYSEVVTWYILGTNGRGYAQYTVALTTGIMYWSQDQGNGWFPVNTVPGPFPRPGGRLYGGVTPQWPDQDLLVFYGGQDGEGGPWVDRVYAAVATGTDPARYYAWLSVPYTLPGLGPWTLCVLWFTSAGVDNWGWWVTGKDGGDGGTWHAWASSALTVPWTAMGRIGASGSSPPLSYPSFAFVSSRGYENSVDPDTLYWLTSDGAGVGYSLQSLPMNFTDGTDPRQARMVPIGPNPTTPIPGPRSQYLFPTAFNPAGIHPDDPAGPLIVGGVGPDGTNLTDVWLGVTTVRCFDGYWGPPQCVEPCPASCGRGSCNPTGQQYPCTCAVGWDVATNCTTCLPGYTCDPPRPLETAAAIAGSVVTCTVLLLVWAVGRIRFTYRRALAVTEYDVFVSYDWRLGKEAAGNIVRQLRAGGMRVWFDEDTMRQRYMLAMVSGVRSSKAAILYVTPAYVTRPNCLVEAEQVLLRAQAGKGAGGGGGKDTGAAIGSMLGSAPFILVCAPGFEPPRDLAPGHVVHRLARLQPQAVVQYERTFGDATWVAGFVAASGALPGAVGHGLASTVSAAGVSSGSGAGAAPMTSQPGAATAVEGAMAGMTAQPAPVVATLSPLRATVTASSGFGLAPTLSQLASSVATQAQEGRAALSALFKAADAQVHLVYMEEHYEVVSAVRSELAARGYTTSGWCQPAPASAVGSIGRALHVGTAPSRGERRRDARALQAAMRRSRCVVLFLAEGFGERCELALSACHMRRERKQPLLFVKVDGGYDPQRTEEWEVAGLVGLSLYVDFSAFPQGKPQKAAAVSPASAALAAILPGPASTALKPGGHHGTASPASSAPASAWDSTVQSLVKQLQEEGLHPALAGEGDAEGGAEVTRVGVMMPGLGPTGSGGGGGGQIAAGGVPWPAGRPSVRALLPPSASSSSRPKALNRMASWR